MLAMVTVCGRAASDRRRGAMDIMLSTGLTAGRVIFRIWFFSVSAITGLLPNSRNYPKI